MNGAFTNHLQALIIDDDGEDRQLIIRNLQRCGTTVICEEAVNGAAGIEALNQHEFDVVLMDYRLSSQTGLELLKQINSLDLLHMPVIILSGIRVEKQVLECLEHGAQDYVLKNDMTPKVLIRTIRYAIERKQVQLQLVEAKNAAENANEAKSLFLANISHDLRTPLTSIRGAFGLIASGMLNDNLDEIVKLSDSGVRNTDRLIGLINDLLDIKKLESGKFTYQMREQNLIPIIHGSIDMVLGFSEKYDVTIEMMEDWQVPIMVNIDEVRMSQAIINLLSNAVKFSRAKERVIVSIEDCQSTVRLLIKDKGVGIEVENQSKIFDQFYQVDSGIANYRQGSGLGLSICKQMIEDMDGTINLESEVGVGTTFYIEFNKASVVD